MFLFSEKVSTIPATASVYEGSDVSVALSEVAKNHKCTWISPTGQEIIVDTVDTCNLKLINVTMKDSGTWTGLSEGDITLFGNFYLSVKGIYFQNDKYENHEYHMIYIISEIDIIEETQVLKLGRSSELTFGPSDSTFCFVISPMGETFPHNTGVCKINIDKVTNKHHGIWQAHVNLPGKLNSVVYYYNIKIEELDLGNNV